MLPTDCPRFKSCNAPICPLDPRWEKAVHLPGERICHYCRAACKEGADEAYRDDAVYAACKVVLPLVVARHPDIGKRLRVGAAVSEIPGQNPASDPPFSA